MPDHAIRSVGGARGWKLLDSYGYTSSTGVDVEPFDVLGYGDLIVMCSAGRNHHIDLQNVDVLYDWGGGGGYHTLGWTVYKGGALPKFDYISGSGYAYSYGAYRFRPPKPITEKMPMHVLTKAYSGDLPSVYVPKGALWLGIHSQLQITTVPDKPARVSEAFAQHSSTNGSVWGWWYEARREMLLKIDSNGGSTNDYNHTHQLVFP